MSVRGLESDGALLIGVHFKKRYINVYIQYNTTAVLNLLILEDRDVQYVHWVMHKCIMVKVGGKSSFSRNSGKYTET